MHRFLAAVCLLVSSANSLPQRGVQLGGGPRPVTFAASPQAPAQGNFGPSYSQQLSFGPADAGLRSAPPGAYRSPQPILLQQGNPSSGQSPAAFTTFASGPFANRGVSPLRTIPVQPVTTGSAPATADDEYEEYEDDEAPPAPQLSVTARPVQRVPVRISQPVTFSQGPQRLVVPQTQAVPVRQRQPVPQRQQPVPVQQSQPQRVQATVANQPSRGQQVASFGIDGKRSRLTTPPPVQTVNRYMRQNDDGSITWGYENEDGTFKEETIGADCVVRGKYGYIDPDGQKREYEYQSGNPCDPNKKDQEEEEEEEERQGPSKHQQVQGVINARPRPRPAQQQRPLALQPQYAS